MHPESMLPATWPYYVRPPAGNPPVDREPKRVREITLLDPCVGSGHFLVRAFELFAQLYAEEGIEDPAEVPALILERNLHGIDIDRRAVQIAALALYLKGCAAAGADFRPRKLNLVASDIVLPPEPARRLHRQVRGPRAQRHREGPLGGPRRGIRAFGSLLHPERPSTTPSAGSARGTGTLWAKDEADWARSAGPAHHRAPPGFPPRAGETDSGATSSARRLPADSTSSRSWAATTTWS